ncbi:MAG TPA: hypothetical protein VJX94_08300 [Stellaceae bacterium]|nr:hypothetical protein [Stellaceae bacterium]
MANSVRPSYTARPGEAIRVFRDDDGSFAIGLGRIKIAPDDVRFVGDVVGDLGRIVHTPEGEDALRRGDAIGHTIWITKPEPPTEPPNAWIVPDDIVAATSPSSSVGKAEGSTTVLRGTGAGCGSTIVYNPADWPGHGDPRSPSSVAVLLMMLRQANLNAAGKSDPSIPDWGTEAEADR